MEDPHDREDRRMRLDDQALRAEWQARQRRSDRAPKGLRNKRLAETREFAHRLLRQDVRAARRRRRSEEHTSELQSLMRLSYAVFCLKKKTHTATPQPQTKTKTHK